MIQCGDVKNNNQISGGFWFWTKIRIRCVLFSPVFSIRHTW